MPTAGVDGDLIDRLLGMMRGDGPIDPRWTHEVGVYVAIPIGGPMLNEVVPIDPDEEPPRPGTMGAIAQEELRNVSYDEWLSIFRERLNELTLLGINEGFLVRSLPDNVTRHLEQLADVGEGNARREALRAGLLEMIDDPVQLERHRSEVAKTDPSVLDLHLDQYGDQLRELAEKMGAPIEVDDVSERWAYLDRWRSAIATSLDDALIDQWEQLNARRNLRLP
jgi:hypothetical protein